MARRITKRSITEFRQHLIREERSEGTISKYVHDITVFDSWMKTNLLKDNVTSEIVTLWKRRLCERGYAPTTVNSMLSSLNGYFKYMGWDDCHIRFLRIQRRVFRDQQRDLTKREYGRLIETARTRGRERLALLMESICATGIRVSEVPFLTVEAAREGHAIVSMKGKVRVIFIPDRLKRKLLAYAEQHRISHGEIFITRNRRRLSRRQIWAEMKENCKYAGVEPSKVFPHNLRHLFALSFYRDSKDIVKLADVLGHSSIDTTRIYLTSTGAEHARQLERLGLVE